MKTRENTDRPARVSRFLSRIGLTFMVGFFLQTTEGFAANDLPTLHAWVRHDSGQAPNLYSIARFNGRWIAGGQDGAVVTSIDGFSWSESQVGLPGDAFEIHQAESAVYLKNPGYCESGPCEKNAYRSADGVSWSQVDSLPAALAPVANLPAPYRPSAPPVQAGDHWLVRAHVSSVNTGAIFASTDGIEWSRVLVNAYELDSLAGRNGLYLASDAEGKILLSTDLVSWTSVRLPNQSWASSVLVGDGFVLAGARSLSGTAGGIYASVDGIEWDLLSITDKPIYGGARIDGAFWFLGQGLIIEVDARKPAPLVNLSVRAAGEDPETSHIAGFVVEGEGPRTMLIRAIGPGLEAFGVGGALASPRLEIWSGQSLVDAGGAWIDEANAAAIQAAAAQVGAFALDPEAGDAALLLTLLPGAYTALAFGQTDNSGQRLIEVYDVTESDSHASALTNSSDRGSISFENPMVGGFVVRGDRDRRILIRAVGPGLQAYNVSETAADPSIAIWQNGERVADNDNWDQGADALVVAEAARTAGAFDLAEGSRDAALIFQAQPGAYTVHVSTPKGSDGGQALLEIYYLDF